MPVYSYTAIDERGVRQHGTGEAENPALLRRDLRAKGWAPLAIEVGRGARQALAGTPPGHRPSRVLSYRYRQSFTYQLSILLEGGMPLDKAISVMTAQERQPPVKALLAALHSRLQEGHAFADCLAFFPQDFGMMYRATVAAGERTGTLDKVLRYLAEYLDLQVTMRQKIQLALFYPALLMGFALLITVGLLSFVVPGIAHSFAHAGHTLPLFTRVVLAASAAMRRYGLAIAALLLAGFLFLKRRLRDDTYRSAWDQRLLRIPLVGKAIVSVELNAFVNTLVMLLRSGVTLVDSMRIAANVVANNAFRETLKNATERVCEGGSLSEALAATGYVPLPLTGMISGGEAGGELTRVLELAARQQSREVQQRAAWLLSILEPCVILVTGLMVLIIVLAMLMPILSLNQLVK